MGAIGSSNIFKLPAYGTTCRFDRRSGCAITETRTHAELVSGRGHHATLVERQTRGLLQHQGRRADLPLAEVKVRRLS